MKLKNKKVLVYGLGDSGRSVIKLLKSKGANVSFYDDDIRYFEYVGFERNPTEKEFDLVVLSPGVKCIGNKLLENFREKEIEIISEIDLAYLFAKGKIIAITGTNGKTTTSMLVYKILKASGKKVFLCGNIGLPFSAVVEKTSKDCVVVCEVSNFQLESSKYFRADVSCVLNVMPDHLDRHGNFEEYLKTKQKITQKIKSKDLLILNFDDFYAKRFFHKKCMYFSKKILKKGVFVKNNQIFVNKKPILSLNEIFLKGEKNLENVLASVSICSKFKVASQDISLAIQNFVPASHRMQNLGEINGVCFIDDSKATNLASTLACVQAFENEQIVLLMGGQGKSIEYDPLFEKRYNIKTLICFGKEGRTIFECAKKYDIQSECFEKFAQAVEYAKEIAAKGDYVLLSPACASYDEFSSYVERGEKFKEIVLRQKL